ncbi:Uncharacterized protein APZ42_001452 [Daphnia magna]|uniref:Uncharacterized protein n=1 Tax=Daphnia magna TaxID=35525 RepID=A0A164IZ80_9CRUS|nr:Uncharacterized protein APZ42_001452 [Daphnia magna]
MCAAMLDDKDMVIEITGGEKGLLFLLGSPGEYSVEPVSSKYFKGN